MPNKNYFISYIFDDGTGDGRFQDHIIAYFDHEMTKEDVAMIVHELAEENDVEYEDVTILSIFRLADDKEDIAEEPNLKSEDIPGQLTWDCLGVDCKDKDKEEKKDLKMSEKEIEMLADILDAMYKVFSFIK